MIKRLFLYIGFIGLAVFMTGCGEDPKDAEVNNNAQSSVSSDENSAAYTIGADSTGETLLPLIEVPIMEVPSTEEQDDPYKISTELPSTEFPVIEVPTTQEQDDQYQISTELPTIGDPVAVPEYY